MKIAFWSYVVCQVALVGVSLLGKMSIWVSLIPTFALVAMSAGLVVLMLLIEFMIDRMEADEEDDMFDWDDMDDENI